MLKRKKMLGCEEVACVSIAFAWDHSKFGKGKDNYVARNVIEATVVSTTSRSNILVVGKCSGLRRRAICCKHYLLFVDTKEDNERWEGVIENPLRCGTLRYQMVP